MPHRSRSIPSRPAPRCVWKHPATLGLATCCLVALGAILGFQSPRAAAQTQVDAVASPQFVPLMDQDGATGCRTRLHLQAAGSEPTRALVFFWGQPAGCGSADALPVTLTCTGLLNPGGSWVLAEPVIPAGTRSAAVFSMQSDLGLQNPDPLLPDPLAGWLCDLLRSRLALGEDVYSEFLEAYRSGGTWQGVNLGLARGGPIAIQMQQDCEAEAGDSGSIALPGMSASSLEPAERQDEDWIYRLPVFIEDEGQVVVQNAGTRCADLRVWLRPPGPDCQPMDPMPCPVPASLAPGESRALDLGACLVPGSAASLELRSQGPLAIVSQVGSAGAAPAASRLPAETGSLLQAPLVFDLSAAWSGRVLVQNLDGARPTGVQLKLLDANGTQRAASQHQLCPTQAAWLEIEIPDAGPIRGNSLRIESLALDPPDAGQAAPAISAVVELQRRGPYRERSRYPMQVVSRDPATRVDRAVLTLPFARQRSEAGGIGRLTLQNQSPDPGFAVVGVYLYDQNGLLDFFCRRLEDQQVEALDLADLLHVDPASFRGSFLISATYWEHLAFTPPDRSSNHLSLAAAISEHSGFGGPPVEAWTHVAASRDRLAEGFPGFFPRCPVSGTGPLPTRPPAPTATPIPTPAGPSSLYLPLLLRR